MQETIIISIVSGKGGTGKTLLSAVLAEMLGNQNISTLVVDLDIFVRGLTSLLYYHKQEALQLTEADEISVADFFINKDTANSNKTNKKKLGISRYRSFDVLPAVSTIDQSLHFQDFSPDNRKEAEKILKQIFDRIPKSYQIVILDCRAGYDELIAAIHSISNITIAVEEDDPIARITAENLVRQLQEDSMTPLFRIVNKARGIVSETDLDRHIRGVSDLGSIPFDIDVMNSFGEATFWDDISKTLYRVALARAWNRLNQRMKLGYELKTSRFSPVSSEVLESRIGFLSSSNRVLFIYGIFIALVGFSIVLIGFDRLTHLTLIEGLSLSMGFAGIVLTFYAVTRSRKKS